MAVTRHTRIYGRKLALVIDGTDYFPDMASYELAPDDKGDILTFGDAAGGGEAWKFKGKAIQSTDDTSLWSMIWEHRGETVDFIVAPHGNATAEKGKPHFKGRVVIGSRPPLSSEAGDDKGAVFDFEWDIEGEPEKVDTGSTIGTSSAGSR